MVTKKVIKTAKKVSKKILTPKKSRITAIRKKRTRTTTLKKSPTLEKSDQNPIIEPRPYAWESKATFNPAAVAIGNDIHIVYRAIGEDDSSALGYAISSDGATIKDRLTHFIYKGSNQSARRSSDMSPVDYISGGGWSGGCEDPRLALIGDTIYMIYTAFDGWGSVRIGMTSILADDFTKKKWNWKSPVLISPPGEINKNWVLFPEKINGKFAILHSFYPKILVDYFDNLEDLDGTKFITSDNTRPIDKTRDWDSWFRGVGPTPLRIKEGWLILYHAMDHRNPDRYRMGALILDAHNPTKILYRGDTPILEPLEHYENGGHKWGVVYSCGAVIKDDTLFVYYGGSDKVVAVASLPLVELIEHLKDHKVITQKIRKISKK
jgi:beta-1,2-mannobiose phosphorylase / 1,2-beta-oligomannan phosphorylase